MSYEPTVWKTGDVVTSAKLNKLENAVANGGVLKLNFTVDNEAQTVTIDRTFAEIKAAFLSGVPVYGLQQATDVESNLALAISIKDNPSNDFYSVSIKNIKMANVNEFETNSETGYPQYSGK